MAPLQVSSSRKVLFLYLIFVIFFNHVHCRIQKPGRFELFGGRRFLLDIEDEDEPPIEKKIKTSSISKFSTKNQTKLVKTTSNLSTNKTKMITGSSQIKNQTKLIKLPSGSSKNKTAKISVDSIPTLKSQFKKLNSTSNSTAKTSLILVKKSPDLLKQVGSLRNKTTTKETEKNVGVSKSKTLDKTKLQKQPKPSSINQEGEAEDLVSEFRELPSKFQQTIGPDWEKISKTSKSYLTKYNKEFTQGFKPYVGNKYASTIASIISFAFIVIPLILVSLIFNKIKAYFSLQKLLIFIQVYLAIYFTILCLSSLVTGLEPLKFFYATSQSTYVCVQVLQTLAYVLYLLLLLMYLILVFSTETGIATKVLGLGQTFVGFSVGLHYYMTVFHRAVLRQPPKTSWKVHSIYATCFVLICLLGRLDRRKKAYLEEDGGEGKKS